MANLDRDMTKQLEEVGRGDVRASDVPGIVRTALAQSKELAPYVYAALSEATWRLIASRAFNDELVDWHEAQRQAEALIEDFDSDLAARCRALSELVAKSHRFHEAQPETEPLNRKHVRELLEFVSENGPKVSRNALREHVGLRDANLSRVLLILTSKGLLVRHGEGREASFSITLDGAAALEAHRRPSEIQVIAPASPDRWWTSISSPLAMWDAQGEAIGCNAAFEGLLEATGAPASSLPPLTAWRPLFADIAESRFDAKQTDEVMVDERTFACRFHDLADGRKLFASFDVSGYKAHEQALEEERSFLHARVAKLNKELADLRHVLSAQEAVARATRQDIVAKVKKYRNVFISHMATGIIDEDTATGKAIDYLTHAVPLGLEHHWLPPILYSEGPGLSEPVDPKRLVETIIHDAGKIAEREVSVRTNLEHLIVANAEELSRPLREISMCFLLTCDSDREAKAEATFQENDLVLVWRGAPSHVGGYGARSKSMAAQALTNCREVIEVAGGSLKWDVKKSSSSLEMRIPIFLHR